MTPRRAARWPLAAALAAILAAAPACRDRVAELSSCQYQWPLLKDYWTQARAALAAPGHTPDLTVLRAIETQLRGRFQQAVAASYDGPDRQAVLAALDALAEAFHAQVGARLDTVSYIVCVRPGVTLAELRAAFAAVDEKFRRLETLLDRP